MRKSKHLFLLVVLTLVGFILFNCTSNEIITNTGNNGENFRVSKIETKYSYDRFTIETFIYNENNQIVENTIIENGILAMKIVNTYNKNGKLIKKLHTQNNDTVETIYTYDNAGNLIKEEWNGNEGTGETIYKYDEKNRMIDMKVTNDTEQIIDDEFYYERYTYDDEGRVVKKIWTESHGLTTTIEYFFDEKGKLIKETRVSQTQNTTVAYAYDEAGNMIKEEAFDEKNGDGYIYYKYDGDLLIEKEYKHHEELHVDGLYYELFITEKYYYDKSGNMIKKEQKDFVESNLDFDSEHNIEITYLYDDYNNLIEQNEVCEGTDTYTVNTKYYYEKY